MKFYKILEFTYVYYLVDELNFKEYYIEIPRTKNSSNLFGKSRSDGARFDVEIFSLISKALG